MQVSHNLCTTPNTNWSRDHLECDRNTQDLSSDTNDLIEIYDRQRPVGRIEVFMECDRGFKDLPDLKGYFGRETISTAGTS